MKNLMKIALVLTLMLVIISAAAPAYAATADDVAGRGGPGTPGTPGGMRNGSSLYGGVYNGTGSLCPTGPGTCHTPGTAYRCPTGPGTCAGAFRPW